MRTDGCLHRLKMLTRSEIAPLALSRQRTAVKKITISFPLLRSKKKNSIWDKTPTETLFFGEADELVAVTPRK
jgi:hypothetical protein